MFGRGIFYILTMLGVLAVVGVIGSIVITALGIELDKASLITLLVISAIFGSIGSIISLFLSKSLVKKSMKVQVITHPRDQREEWLVKTVSLLAVKKGLKMPEVGIYYADDMNAFASGWNKDDALVAVSSGLLDRMEQDEVEAVLGHEMSHVANGDMVTQTLLQGVLNTFVYFFSFVIAQVIIQALSNNRSSNDDNGRNYGGNYFVYHMITNFLQMIFGFLATLVVLWFSRWREYRADAGSAEVLGSRAMIKALEALKEQHVEKKPDSVKALCISGADSFAELFMTHPPLEKRIEALKSKKYPH